MDWIDLAEDRYHWGGGALVNKVTNLRVPQNVGKFLSSYTTGSSSKRAQLRAYKLYITANVNGKYVSPKRNDVS
jgi:hypothetical protein